MKSTSSININIAYLNLDKLDHSMMYSKLHNKLIILISCVAQSPWTGFGWLNVFLHKNMLFSYTRTKDLEHTLIILSPGSSSTYSPSYDSSDRCILLINHNISVTTVAQILNINESMLSFMILYILKMWICMTHSYEMALIISKYFFYMYFDLMLSCESLLVFWYCDLFSRSFGARDTEEW